MGNGMENAGVLDAVNDMLMQSWRGRIELFPAWPSARNGSFSGLRARGAFIVSAQHCATRGLCGSSRIESLAGANCSLFWPYPSQPSVTEEVSGKLVAVDAGEDSTYHFRTNPGRTYLVAAPPPRPSPLASFSRTPGFLGGQPQQDVVICTSRESCPEEAAKACLSKSWCKGFAVCNAGKSSTAWCGGVKAQLYD